MIRANPLRQSLAAGKRTIGTHIIVPWPGVIETIGQTGVFDYVEYVGEYSPFNLELLDNMARAIELFPGLGGMMKVEEQTRGFVATRAIDAGFGSVLFADCRSADEVRECVSFVRADTPERKGRHGAAARRSAGYGMFSGTEEWVQALDDVVVAIMIEKAGAMAELDEILAIPGVDMVQFGPVDYSVSIGQPGRARTDEIRAVERNMIERALEAGVAPRVELASARQMQPFLDLGVRHFCIGTDLGVLGEWSRRQGGQLEALARENRDDV